METRHLVVVVIEGLGAGELTVAQHEGIVVLND